ncbi:thiol-disulfide oxidoreductase DCC family protein [Cohnella sp. REN36]|uniref:thiol-disulfide oxidoreductase DCC family protein n=1 Tax=Cohnella sp. REN36 TaxID=2887347 RepID=UPI001D133DE7|nr:DUF393 domain-containing protein [Cohnella sp. REN36]MCC3376930.1 DUF393 domain-containing protein [Cohnella sp. REN36]
MNWRGDDALPRPALTVVYDGECNLCLATVAKLQTLRTRSEIRYATLQSLEEGSIPSWPAIAHVPAERLAAQLHVTDEAGRLYGGSEAVMRLLQEVPSLRWLAVLGGLPGMKGVSRALYRLIARHRYRLFGRTPICADGVCRLPDTKPNDGGKPT